MERLTLIISNTCNMSCRYCYANGGNYHSTEGLMAPETAVHVFDHFLNHMGPVRQVLFFGGEPLLAVPVIEAVCSHVESLVTEGKISCPPKFSMVTNGTLIDGNPLFISLVKAFDFSVTISLDGPPLINDRARKMKGGKGSFNRILKGLLRLKQENIPYSIECTYTPFHFEQNWLLEDLYAYLRMFEPENIIFIEEMHSGETAECKDFSAKALPQWIHLFHLAIKEWEENGRMRLAGPEKILNAIAVKPEFLSERFCEGGLDSFAVNRDGMVYPCHILNNIQRFCMGRYTELTSGYDVLPLKKDIDDCESCPIKRYCQSCPAKMYRSSGETDFQAVHSQCNLNKATYLLARKSLAG